MFGFKKPRQTKEQRREAKFGDLVKSLTEYLKHRTHRRDLGLEPQRRQRRRRSLAAPSRLAMKPKIGRKWEEQYDTGQLG